MRDLLPDPEMMHREDDERYRRDLLRRDLQDKARRAVRDALGDTDVAEMLADADQVADRATQAAAVERATANESQPEPAS
jgi:hypothetical protein